MIPEVNIISRKVSLNEAGVSGGCSEPLSGDFRGQRPPRKYLGSKEHLDWLE